MAEGIAEQAGPVRRQPLPQPGLRLGDLVFSLRFVRHGVEVAADQAVGAWIGQAGVIVVPAVVLDGHQTRGLRRAPPGLAHPASTDQAGAVHLCPRCRVGNDEAGEVQARLCVATVGGAKVEQGVVEAALAPVRRVVEVVIVEIAAVVAAQGHGAVDVVCGQSERVLDHLPQRHDAQAETLDQG